MSRYLSAKSVEEKFDITRQTLWNWEKEGIIDPGKTPGGQRRYDEDEILELLELEPDVPEPNKKLRGIAEQASNQLMETFGDVIHEIILYGSVARGEADEKSDIDLIVVVQDVASESVRWTGRFHEALMDLKLKHDVIISLQVFTVDEWEEMKGTPFYREVEDQDGIRLRQQVA